MREETVRSRDVRTRERFDLSLDGRQIASIVVGALVMLGVVFALGLNVGRQLARREAEAARPPDALDALDRPPAPPAPSVQAEALTYHERLTKAPPRSPVLQAGAAEPAPAKAQVPAAPATSAAVATAIADPTPAAEATAKADTTPTTTSGATPARAGWCIQLGAVHDRTEADRIAAKFRSARPRIEQVDLSGTRWYRVRVGSFESRTAAERTLDDLARQTGAKGYVTASR
jgi:DedD protein